MIRLQDQRRFQVEVATGVEDARLLLSCDRCTWWFDLDTPSSLDELNDRAAEHVEVCR